MFNSKAMLSTAKLFLQILLRVTPIAVKEINRQKAIGESNDKLELAVLRRKRDLEGLSIEKIIEIGAKK